MSVGLQWVIAIITVLGGGIGIAALIRVFRDRPKVRAEAVKIITEASATSSAASAATVVALSERLERVERKAEAQGEQIDKQGEKIAEQEHQIGSLTDYVDRVSGWSVRHQPYDAAVRPIARDHKIYLPPLEEFPVYDPPGHA